MMTNQFSDVSSKYGAPMGRREYGTPTGPARLFKVRFVDHDYDDGGAYWGGGTPLYYLRTEESQHFFRAKTWPEAVKLAKESFPDAQLAEPEIDVDSFFTGYVEAALWSSTDNSDETGGEPLDMNYDDTDLHEKTAAAMRADCERFIEANRQDLIAAVLQGRDSDYLGHDFWLTRNGHGTGFWDRCLGDVGERLTKACKKFGEINLIVGDDGKIHQ